MTNLVSLLFGMFASHEFPQPIQKAINYGYVKAFDINMSEFESSDSYKSLNKLFTRKFVKMREINASEDTIVSPCDARITEFGNLNNFELLQIKGKSYSLSELLASGEKAKRYKDGQFVNFYLSPRDYHRFHAPMDMKVLSSTHIPGKLYPVNMPALKYIDSLFAKNERVLLECEDSRGNGFYLVFIGALNVGKIVISFDDRIKTNAKEKETTTYEYENLFLKRGDEIGMFEMGSSIVAIFEKDYANLSISKMQKVNFTDTIGIRVR